MLTFLMFKHTWVTWHLIWYKVLTQWPIKIFSSWLLVQFTTTVGIFPNMLGEAMGPSTYWPWEGDDVWSGATRAPSTLLTTQVDTAMIRCRFLVLAVVQSERIYPYLKRSRKPQGFESPGLGHDFSWPYRSGLRLGRGTGTRGTELYWDGTAILRRTALTME